MAQSVSARNPVTGIGPTPYTEIQWGGGASSCLDDVSVHTVDLAMSPAPIVPVKVRVSVPVRVVGKGSYGFDYRIRTPYGPATEVSTGVYEFTVPPGYTSYALTLDINQNHDTSETYELTLISNSGWYTLGSTLLHTVTCTGALAKPTAATTGYGSTVLTSSGGLELGDGAVVTALDVSTNIKIAGSNCHVSFCWVRGGGNDYGVYEHSSASYPGQLVEYCKIGDDTTIPDSSITTLSGSVFNIKGVVRRCHMTAGRADGIKFRGGMTVEECFLEKYYDEPTDDKDSHCDGSQIHDGGSGFVLRNNHIFMPWPGTPIAPAGAHFESNSLCFVDGLAADDILIEGNWLYGGHWSIWLAQPQVAHTRVVLKNNRFSIYNYGWQDPVDLNRCADHCFVADNPQTDYKIIGSKWDDGPEAGLPIDQINNYPVW